MQLYIATNNTHKVEEIQTLVNASGLELSVERPPEGMPEVEETGSTFEENARIKCSALKHLVSQDSYVLADDSGLVVDALDGAPGVHSARYAGIGASDAQNNEKLLKALAGIEHAQRTARFVCVLVLEGIQGTSVFRGTCEGVIARTQQGSGGFGYDPLFIPRDNSKSFAELGASVKNTLSHRAKALENLLFWLRSR